MTRLATTARLLDRTAADMLADIFDSMMQRQEDSLRRSLDAFHEACTGSIVLALPAASDASLASVNHAPAFEAGLSVTVEASSAPQP